MSAVEEPSAPRKRTQTVRFDRMPKVPPRTTWSMWATEWWLAWRHLRSKKAEAFLSVVTILSVIGVTMGVAVLNIVISVMTGFEIDLRDKILGANAHIVVFRSGGNLVDVDDVLEKVDQVDGVTASAPFLYTEMMLRSPWGSKGAVVKGIDPRRTADVTHVLQDLREAYGPTHESIMEYSMLDSHVAREFLISMDLPFAGIGLDNSPLDVTAEEPELPGIIIGKELKAQLQVRVGDKVQLINPLGGGAGPMGMPTPSVKSVRVAGIFDSGMYEYDTTWTYVENELLQDFLKVGESATGVEIKVDDIDDVDRISADLDESLGYPYYAKHWKNLNAKLFAALTLEKLVMGLLLGMIVVIAGLLIVTSLIMIVITKGREIAILKAMGATRGNITRIFVMQGSAIGLIGTILGTLLGLAGCGFLDWYGYRLETDVYYLDTLPVVVDPLTVAVIAVGAFFVCFVCTIYPALRAASLDPVEALRYE